MITGCAHAQDASSELAKSAKSAPVEIELVQSAPIETELIDPKLPHAHEVWLRMITGAKRSLDIAQFYISNEPNSRMVPIVDAIEARARAGVKVRILVEKIFAGEYPKTLARLEKVQGIEVRRYDIREITDGILNAKYFVVDGAQAFLGSQNMDWRALIHIQELGARVTAPAQVKPLQHLFEVDWALAGGAAPKAALTAAPPSEDIVFSPKDLLPEGLPFDLSALVSLIEGAQRSVRVQLLSYKPAQLDGTPFVELDQALRAAAARGVKVELLLSHWATDEGKLGALQNLGGTKGLQIKLLTVPQYSGGFIPFARVCHAKYLVVDGERGWLGTSDWSHDNFYSSRNVGLLLRGAQADQLETIFARGWQSSHAAPLRLEGSYPSPRLFE